MVCTTDDISAWKDFPKGLKVLLLDEDSSSAAEIKSKLEAMDYTVSTFCNENEALSAVSDTPESFHVAIVEVSTSNSDGRFKFLETAKDLPTIMTSNIHCLNTMMKCIALGAVEFLRKPLSEDKLRNIWQHVLHKAFSSGGCVLSESLKPVKDSVVSMLQLKLEIEENQNENMEKTENGSFAHEDKQEQSPISDKYPAPSTPQLKQGGWLLDDGDCQDAICSIDKESGEQDGESKSVETTCAMSEETLQVDHPQSVRVAVIKEEGDLNDGVKNGNNICPNPQNTDNVKNTNSGAENSSKASGLPNSCRTRTNRKKIKVDWTPDLHRKFEQAVEKLGVDHAIPSRILELMKVEGLTRHNVASHLQKYRMHKRHILPKDDDRRRWPPQRDQIQRSYFPHKPVMAYPPYHSNHAYPPSPVYPMWGATGSHRAGVHMWSPPGYPPWRPTESWLWKPYPAGMHADAWGCPVLPPPHSPHSSFPQKMQNASGFQYASMVDNRKSFEAHPAEEVIDKVVKEAINKPWLPLPLGLKPPSTDGVLAELSRQGMSTIPPRFNGSS